MNMIRFAMMSLTVVVLAACGREPSDMQTVPVPLPAPAPAAELVDELARDPERLKEVRRLCREERDAVSEELCIASAQATRRRFMGEGETRYTPEPVALPEAELPKPQDE